MDDVRAELRHPAALAGRPAKGQRRRPALLALCAVFVAGAAACRAAAPARDFDGLFATKERAAQAVVDALAARDAARLLDLAVSDDEFRLIVWPRLPASRPEVGMPVEYVWADTSTKSRGHLAETVARLGGAPRVVEGVRFAGGTVDYGTFRIHADTRLRVREGELEVDDVRLFGAMVESPGGWKVFSYIVD